MSRFISGQTIRNSVQHLGNSTVRGTFFEYCILLAALSDQKSPDGSTALNGKALRPIIDDAALWTQSDDVDSSELPPYFNPLDKRYKTKKYWTNGPSDTIPRWATQGNIVEIVPGAATKTVKVAPFSGTDVQAFFSIKETGRVLLSDLAVWWFRKTDLDKIFPSQSEVQTQDIEDALLDVLGLDRAAAEQIFEISETNASEPVATEPDQADPAEYMPDYQKPPSQGTSKSLPAPAYSYGDIAQLTLAISERGFVFSDLQIASFVAAARAKPFIILAGISGTGKTSLPIIAAQSTQSRVQICAVRPNWTDSTELLGYSNLSGEFIPGPLLKFAREAIDDPETAHFFILDEMNLAHVEYYFAEVLSIMETTYLRADGKTVTQPLNPEANGTEWASTYLPQNLVIVGSINVDESTNPISRKVLDRAFVIKFSEVDLNSFIAATELSSTNKWASSRWGSDRKPLRDILTSEVQDTAIRIASILESINKVLRPAKCSFGYRLRDDVIQFVLAASGIEQSFKSHNGELTHPLDIAISAKLLPRLEGSSRELERSIHDLIDLLENLQEGDLTFTESIESLNEMANSFSLYGYASYWN